MDRPVICHPGLPDDVEREIAEGWIVPVPSPELAEAQPAGRPVGQDGEGPGRVQMMPERVLA